MILLNLLRRGDFNVKKVFKSGLSVKELENLKNELKNYKSEIVKNTEIMVSRLLQSGVAVSQAKISESPLGKYVTVTTNISANKMGCKGVLLAKGAVKEQEGYAPFSVLLAIEFGAGAHFNPDPNPLSAEMGYGVGTYPGQIHAFDPNGWYFWSEEKQQWIHSYGVKATMPMYSADMEIIQNVVNEAKKVFRE